MFPKYKTLEKEGMNVGCCLYHARLFALSLSSYAKSCAKIPTGAGCSLASRSGGRSKACAGSRS